MFVILNPIYLCNGVIRKKLQKASIERSCAAVCRTDSGLPFFILDVPLDKHGANGKFISDCCGRYSSRLIAPENFSVPDGFGLKRFLPKTINSLLTFNTAVALLKKAGLPCASFVLTLTDRNAVHPNEVCRLLEFASKVRVVTANEVKYANAVIKAMSDYGASLMIKEKYSPCSENELVICADGCACISMQKAAVISFRNALCGEIRINGRAVDLAEEHKRLLPCETDSVDFAGAVTELCRSDEYKDSTYSFFSINGKECSEHEAVEKLRRKFGFFNKC